MRKKRVEFKYSLQRRFNARRFLEIARLAEDAGSIAQVPPASHAAAASTGLGKVFPRNACLQHKQDAVEGGFIADCELARSTFGGRHEGWDQGLQLSPQFVAYGSSCHEGSEHNR